MQTALEVKFQAVFYVELIKVHKVSLFFFEEKSGVETPPVCLFMRKKVTQWILIVCNADL